MIQRPIRAVAVVATAALVSAGCSSSASGPKSSSAHGARLHHTPRRPRPRPTRRPGPYAVGYTTLHLAGGRRVVVWYPAQPGGELRATRRRRSTSRHAEPGAAEADPARRPRALQGQRVRGRAGRATTGGYPLVIFSHGFAGYPEQSVSLTTHLASWGFVVAAPDHVERSLDGLLGTAAQGVPKSTDLAVLQATLDLARERLERAGLLHGLVDPNAVVAAGPLRRRRRRVPVRVGRSRASRRGSRTRSGSAGRPGPRQPRRPSRAW